jgi:hypothetical protein
MIVGKAVRKQIVQRHQLPRDADRSGVAWRPKWSSVHAGKRCKVALLPRMTPGSADPMRKRRDFLGIRASCGAATRTSQSRAASARVISSA